MDESALRKTLASLDVCSSSQHWWLGFWTFLVVAGVTLEIVFVVWEYIEDLHECRRSLLYPPLKPNLLLFSLGLFGAGLVAVGVAGELYVESKIATAETCIRKGNDELTLLLSKKAGDAAESAKRAEDSAKVTGNQAERAKDEADIVTKRAEDLTQYVGVVAKNVNPARN
jgi:hypothetical protein